MLCATTQPDKIVIGKVHSAETSVALLAARINPKPVSGSTHLTLPALIDGFITVRSRQRRSHGSCYEARQTAAAF